MRSRLDDPKAVAERFKIEPLEWISILSRYTARDRLVAALPLLMERHGGKLQCSHKELATFLCASREKVTIAISKLREEGTLAGGGPRRDPLVLIPKP